jgi:integrase
VIEKAAGPIELRDTKTPGLICRVRGSGRKTFEIVLKRRGVRWSKKLGAWPHITLGAAREAAQSLLGAEIAKLPTSRSERIAGSITLRDFLEEQYFKRVTLRAEAEARRVLGLDRPEEGFKGRRDDDLTWLAFLDTPLREIRRGEIEATRARWLKAGAAPATVNRKSTVLRAVLSRACEWHELSDHPMKGVKPVKVEDDAHARVLTEAERGRLYGVIDAGDADAALGTGIYLLLGTGARMGELRGLRPADVDLKAKAITIRATTSKTGKTRRVPISRTLAERLEKFGTWAPPTRKQWNTIMRRAQIGDDFTPHSARHDFCSRLANSGVPPHVVMRLAGHSTIVVTGKYYLHAGDDALRAAVERF